MTDLDPDSIPLPANFMFTSQPRCSGAERCGVRNSPDFYSITQSLERREVAQSIQSTTHFTSISCPNPFDPPGPYCAAGLHPPHGGATETLHQNDAASQTAS